MPYDESTSFFAASLSTVVFSDNTISQILALTSQPGATSVTLSDYSAGAATVPPGVVVNVPSGQTVTSDPGGSVLLMNANSGGANVTLSANTPRVVVGSGNADNIVFSGSAPVTVQTGGGSDHIVLSGGNNQVTITGSGSPSITGGTGNDYVIVQGTSNRTIDFGSGNNTLYLQTGGGSSTVVAGGGVDVVQLNDQASNHNFGFYKTVLGNVITVLSSSPTDMVGIDLVQFQDGVTVLADNAAKGDMARLYEVMFDRQGDVDGLKYWLGTVAAGAKISDIAKAFAASPEFQSKFASVDNTTYLQALYQGMAGRTADHDGLQYWLSQMANGMSRSDVALYFADSAEAVQLMGINGTKYVIDLV